MVLDSFLKRWIAVSLLLHLAAAVFSVGYYHADEHFQILEFLNWKLGKSPASDLAIEFHERLRPWLQPSIYLGISRALSAVGIENPFHWAFSFRLLSALIGWTASVAVMLCAYYRWFATDSVWRKRAVIIQALIWFMPALHARHSSENLGGAVFLIGLCLVVLWPRLRSFLAAGALMGLAFHFRYQVGTMVAGFAAWALFLNAGPLRLRTTQSAMLIAGMLPSLAFGIVLDRWGYGEWVFAPWNYVHYNLVLGKVAVMDTSPFWDYFRRATTESWPLLGLLLLISYLIAWVRNPRHVLACSLAPIFLVHVAIGHKELRFLFPMLHAAGPVVALALSGARIPSSLFRAGIAWNAIALVITTLTPAWMPYRFLKHVYDRPIERLHHLPGENPYVINGIAMNFYRKPGMELRETGASPPETGYHLRRRGQMTEAAECQLEYSSHPMLLFGKFQHVRITNWSLFRCDARF